MAANYDKADEMMDNLVGPTMENLDEVFDSNPEDDIEYDLAGLSSEEQDAVTPLLSQCQNNVNKGTDAASAWVYGCTLFLYAYGLSYAYDNGLKEQLAEQYPLF